MTLSSLLIFSLPIISGALLAHLLWPNREVKGLLYKLFLGMAIGPGLTSLLYFIYLLIFNDRAGFFFVQLFILAILITITIVQEQSRQSNWPIPDRPTTMQYGLLAAASIAVIISIVVYANVSLRRPHGAWDSWMIYNRAARFIYRGGEEWKTAFSPDLYWYFHADYPLLIPLNVAWGWEILGQETVRVPMILSGIFLAGCAGILFTALNLNKSLGQGSLALTVLLGGSDFTTIASKQIADVPLSGFILATGTLLYLYTVQRKSGLLILAGLSTGLAAWAKNEGILFMVVSLMAVLIAFRPEARRVLPSYLIGLALPLFVVIYFKGGLAPSSDLFDTSLAQVIRQALESARHLTLLQAIGQNILVITNWTLLLVYLLIFGIDKPKESVPALVAGLLIVFLQVAGYDSIYLITPHALKWHLSALYRLLLHLYPLVIFLYFCVVRTPESIFQGN